MIPLPPGPSTFGTTMWTETKLLHKPMQLSVVNTIDLFRQQRRRDALSFPATNNVWEFLCPCVSKFVGPRTLLKLPVKVICLSLMFSFPFYLFL